MMNGIITYVAGENIEVGDFVMITGTKTGDDGMYVVKKAVSCTEFVVSKPCWFARLWWNVRYEVFDSFPFLRRYYTP